MLKKSVKKFFSIFGFTISKVTKSEDIELPISYFEFDESCQIPFLSEIYESYFSRDTRGLVVEVGAYDGRTYSNSIGLINRGWQALLIEPIPEFFEKCVSNYLENQNVKIFNKAISDKDGSVTMSIAGPLSTFDKNTQDEYSRLNWATNQMSGNEIVVETQSLDKFLTQNGVEAEFELLIVDVEGAESKVFKGFDLNKWKPKLMIVELADFHPFLTAAKKDHWILGNQIINSGYQVIYKDAINTIFGKSDFVSNIFQ